MNSRCMYLPPHWMSGHGHIIIKWGQRGIDNSAGARLLSGGTLTRRQSPLPPADTILEGRRWSDGSRGSWSSKELRAEHARYYTESVSPLSTMGKWNLMHRNYLLFKLYLTLDASTSCMNAWVQIHIHTAVRISIMRPTMRCLTAHLHGGARMCGRQTLLKIRCPLLYLDHVATSSPVTLTVLSLPTLW